MMYGIYFFGGLLSVSLFFVVASFFVSALVYYAEVRGLIP